MIEHNDIKLEQISTEALAYLGDSVIELCARDTLVCKGISSSKKLNSEALGYVKASVQAAAMKSIMDLLTEEELLVFKRGRNHGHTNTPKSASVSEYRSATGMETLFGYLFLKNQTARINELFKAAYKDII